MQVSFNLEWRAMIKRLFPLFVLIAAAAFAQEQAKIGRAHV